MGLLGRKLRRVAGDRRELGLQMPRDVHHQRPVAMRHLRHAREQEVGEKLRHRVHRQAGERVVPLREPRIEDGRLRDRHSLGVVGRGEGRFVAEAEHEPRPPAAKDRRQRHADLEVVEQPAVGEGQRFAVDHAERFRRGGRLAEPFRGAARPGRRLAVGQVHDPDPMPLGGQQRQRAATADLDVVGVSAHRDHVEWLWQVDHRWVTPASWRRSGRSD